MIVAEGSIAAAKRENIKLKTLLRICARHWLSARWRPAAANDDFSDFGGLPA